MSEESTDDSLSRTKVGRLIAEYDLPAEFGTRLEASWTGEGTERRSLRDLADLFNRRLLESAMADADVSSVAGEVDNLYELLTGDDVSAGDRTEAENRLERAGIDVDGLRGDFVTYQAVRTYLQRRGATYDQPTDEEQLRKDHERIRGLRSKTATITEDRLASLRNTDRLDLDEFRVFADVNVLCESCLTRYSIEELFEQGGCSCQQES